MELFIQIRDGLPFGHPIYGDNFRQAFPDVDLENLPPEFARFERIVASSGEGRAGRRPVGECHRRPPRRR